MVETLIGLGVAAAIFMAAMFLIIWIGRRYGSFSGLLDKVVRVGCILLYAIPIIGGILLLIYLFGSCVPSVN